MAGVSCTGDGATFLGISDGTDIVMTKMDQDEVSRLERVINTFPTSLTYITTCRTASHGGILPCDLSGIEDDTCL